MRVHVVDPPAYTPPYDHALCDALARAGAEVTLVTTAFRHGRTPEPETYERREFFYPGAAGRLGRLARHVPDMLRYRSTRREADVVHLQWLPVQQLDWTLLPARPRILTAHDILPREASAGQRSGQKRILARMDAVIVHSQHGARRLREEAGVASERIHVIPHGAFTHLVVPGTLPEPLRKADRPVVLFFGLLRPYKGIDVLVKAFKQAAPGADLWIVGMPRMEIERDPAATWLPRYVDGAELAGVFEAADLVVLPYREIDQSGVLFTALAFGKPLLLSDVGGFPEVAATGAAELVPPGDTGALAGALTRLLGDPDRLAGMAAAAREVAASTYSWDDIARRTLAVYESTLQT